MKIYISSADLMTRNTERRIEIACPISDIDLKQQIIAMLETMLADNTKAWEQFSDGNYVLRPCRPDTAVNSQEIFIRQARAGAMHSSGSEKNAKFRSFLNGIKARASKYRPGAAKAP